MIYLRAQSWSSLGDDTFWCWALRELPNAVAAENGTEPSPGDHVLHYGLLGAPTVGADRSVALLWEQYPEMHRALGPQWPAQLQLMHDAAAGCARRTVASPLFVDDYARHGPVDVLPIAIDTELWRPPATEAEKRELRERHGIPHTARVGFWGGTQHPMKGWDLFGKYASAHPHTHWVVAFKRRRDKARQTWPGVMVAEVPQPHLAELMRLCDFALFTSRLRPYVILEWEAMATNLPVVDVGVPDREFDPGPYPRDEVLRRGWDRTTALRTWREYLGA